MILKILNQEGTELFDLEKNNLFVCGNKILISNETNIYQGKAALLGLYNDEEEAKEVFSKIIDNLMYIIPYGPMFCFKMPKPKEKQQEDEKEGVEDAKDGE